MRESTSLSPRPVLAAVLLLCLAALALAQTPPPRFVGPGVVQPVKVGWTPVKGAVRYWLQVSGTPALTPLAVNNDGITATVFTLPPLAHATPHFWHVKAILADNTQTDWSPVWAFTTAPQPKPAAAPTLLKPDNGAAGVSTAPRLTWTPVDGAANYWIQVDTENTFTAPVVINKGSPTSFLDIAGLTPNTKYYWRVCGFNDTGNGPYSEVWSFTTTAALPPSIPVLVSPANNALNVPRPVTLSWQAAERAQKYTVQVAKTLDGFGTPLATYFNISATNFTLPQAAANTKHFWRVQAVNAAGVSGWSDVWNFTTAPEASQLPPTVPVLVGPPNNATNVPRPVLLSWLAAERAQKYWVQACANDAFTALVFSTYAQTSTSISVMMPAGKKVFWRVKAQNAVGTSDWSPVWNFTTQPEISQLPPTVPVLLGPANNATNVPRPTILGWLPAERAQKYWVQVCANEAFTAFVFSTYAQTSTSVSVILPAAKKVFWRVKAQNTVGTSDWSPIWNFTTAAETPPPPLPAPPISSPAPGATGVARPVTLQWGAVTGPQGSTVVYGVIVAANPQFLTPVFTEGTVNGTSIQVSNLQANTHYYWKVAARTTGGLLGTPAIADFTTAP